MATTSQAAVEEARKRSEQHERLTRARDIASTINTHLEMRQDVLLAMVVTEDGVAAAKVVSSPTELAVFGIVATEEGVVVRGAVLTPDVAHNEEWGQVLEWGAVGVDAETGTVIGGRGVVAYDEEWGQVLKW